MQRRKAGWTRADLTRGDQRRAARLPRPPRRRRRRRAARPASPTRRSRSPSRSTRARPGDALLPDELRLANGESAYQSPRRAAVRDAGARAHRARSCVAGRPHAGGAAALPHAVAASGSSTGCARRGIELGVDQAAAVRGVLTSGARVETLVGPAGTGKSFVVGAIARGWTDPALRGDDGRAGCSGWPPRQIATDVLAGEGLTARNVARWLATQDRLAAGPGTGGPQPIDGDEAWRLHAGDLVVVDESAMTDTAALAADPPPRRRGRGEAAAGRRPPPARRGRRGRRHGPARPGRRPLRAGRGPPLHPRVGARGVAAAARRRRRPCCATTTSTAGCSTPAPSSRPRPPPPAAWLADTLAGRRSLLLVDTNEQAARLSAQLRAELVRLGRVSEDGVPLGLQGTVAGVGDLVQARCNGWDLAGLEGNRRGPINRETYRVTAVRDDGGLDVAPILGRRPDGPTLGERMVLPAAYVAEHLALGLRLDRARRPGPDRRHLPRRGHRRGRRWPRSTSR